METLTTTEKIERLRQELADLEAQERIEKEEARKKERAERETDLQNMKDAINAFNKKYNDTLCLGIKRNLDVGKDLFDTLFPWWGD